MPILQSPIDVPVVSAMRLRRQSGELLDRVALRGEKFIIERAGKVKAVLIPLTEYSQIERQREITRQQLLKTLQEVQRSPSDLTDDELQQRVDNAIATVRATSIA